MQTDLRSAHVVAQRIAGVLKNTMRAPPRGRDQSAANVTLATLKAGDTRDSLMLRVMAGRLPPSSRRLRLSFLVIPGRLRSERTRNP
jgi:hypothetical protein